MWENGLVWSNLVAWPQFIFYLKDEKRNKIRSNPIRVLCSACGLFHYMDFKLHDIVALIGRMLHKTNASSIGVQFNFPLATSTGNRKYIGNRKVPCRKNRKIKRRRRSSSKRYRKRKIKRRRRSSSKRSRKQKTRKKEMNRKSCMKLCDLRFISNVSRGVRASKARSRSRTNDENQLRSGVQACNVCIHVCIHLCMNALSVFMHVCITSVRVYACMNM